MNSSIALRSIVLPLSLLFIISCSGASTTSSSGGGSSSSTDTVTISGTVSIPVMNVPVGSAALAKLPGKTVRLPKTITSTASSGAAVICYNLETGAEVGQGTTDASGAFSIAAKHSALGGSASSDYSAVVGCEAQIPIVSASSSAKQTSSRVTVSLESSLTVSVRSASSTTASFGTIDDASTLASRLLGLTLGSANTVSDRGRLGQEIQSYLATFRSVSSSDLEGSSTARVFAQARIAFQSVIVGTLAGEIDLETDIRALGRGLMDGSIPLTDMTSYASTYAGITASVLTDGYSATYMSQWRSVVQTGIVGTDQAGALDSLEDYAVVMRTVLETNVDSFVSRIVEDPALACRTAAELWLEAEEGGGAAADYDTSGNNAMMHAFWDDLNDWDDDDYANAHNTVVNSGIDCSISPDDCLDEMAAYRESTISEGGWIVDITAMQRIVVTIEEFYEDEPTGDWDPATHLTVIDDDCFAAATTDEERHACADQLLGSLPGGGGESPPVGGGESLPMSGSGGFGASCTANSECLTGYFCLSQINVCIPSCLNSTCLEGQECATVTDVDGNNNAACAQIVEEEPEVTVGEEPELGSPPPQPLSGSCTTDADCSLSTPYCVMNACAAALLPNGAFCVADSDCGSGLVCSSNICAIPPQPQASPFASVAEIDIGSDPNSVWTDSLVVLDANSDGNLDFAATRGYDGMLGLYQDDVSVFIGNGSGGFVRTDYKIGINGLSGLAAASIDSTVGVDLVAAVTGGGSPNTSIAFLSGNMDGIFDAATSISSGTGPLKIATGDGDNDGDIDVFVTCYLTPSSNNLSVHANNAGTLQSATNLNTFGAYGFSALIADDLNGDGNLDLAALDQMNKEVLVALGDGALGFGAATSYSFADQLQVNSIALALLNGDANADLIVTSNTASASSVSILLGNGDGTFAAAVAYDTGATGSSPIAVADFDGDTNLDMVLGNGGGLGTISLLTGNGDGTFDAATEITISDVGYAPIALQAADFNNDGQSDLIIGLGDGSIVLLLNL